MSKLTTRVAPAALPIKPVDQVNPSLLALFGLAYLALAPFAILHGNVRLGGAAAFVAVCIAFRPRLLGARTAESIQILDVPRLRRIYLWSGLIFLGAMLCDAISTAILLDAGLAEGLEILDRGGKQLGTLLMCLVQLAAGYHLAKYVKEKTVWTTVHAGFWLTLGVCGYQIAADTWGLPYIGALARDATVGLRPSGLVGEPKFLAVYLLSVVPLLLVQRGRRRRSTLVPPLFGILGAGLATFFFFRAASGNGFVGAAILIAIYFILFTTPRRAALGIALLLVALATVPGYQLSSLNLRESHQSILNNLQNLDLGLFDDLIMLPLLAWKDNPLSLLIGFGPGFLHFFAWKYADQGTWIVPGVLVDGNLAVIKYASDYGLIEATILFVYIFRKAKGMFLTTGGDKRKPLKVYFLSAFVLGVLVGGNNTVPLFLGAGWILGTSKEEERERPRGLGLTSPHAARADQ